MEPEKQITELQLHFVSCIKSTLQRFVFSSKANGFGRVFTYSGGFVPTSGDSRFLSHAFLAGQDMKQIPALFYCPLVLLLFVLT